MLALTSRDLGRKSTSSYHRRAMSILDQFVKILTCKETSTDNILISAADDVFVREDLLKTKYNFVDYISAEKYSNWLQPLLQVHCGGSHRPESYVFQQSNSIRFTKKC